MATTKTTEELFSGNGSQTNFPFTIEYLRTSDIAVRVSGVLQTETTDYSVVGTNIVFVAAPATGSNNIKITRITDIDAARSIYAAGSSIRAKDLNTNHDQILFKLQEKDTRIPASTTSNTPPTDAVSGDRWYDTVSGRSFIYYTDVDSSQWVEENPAFDADEFTTNITNTNVATNAAIAATKLSFTQTGTGATARTVDNKFKDIVSVKDFGATGDGSTDDTTAIQAALTAASGNSKVFLPKGTYMVSATINIPSNTHFVGEGKSSVIKMLSSVGRSTTLVRTGVRGSKREYIVIEDMTLDFNSARHTVSGGEVLTDTVDDTSLGGDANQDNDETTLSICFSEHVLIKNVRCLDGYKHNIDVTAPKYKKGTNGATYDTEPSKYVTLQNCYAKGAGDDNITTHFSTDILITGCISERPSGVRTPQNSNCFEIDDGSRNVTLTNNTAIKGIKGLEIKGHNYAPAAYNVIVDGFRAVNCNVGVILRHIGFYGDNSTSFNGDGSTAAFTLPAGFGTTPKVYVGGVLKTASTHYNVSGTTLTFTSGNIPASGTGNIIVYKSTNDSDEIEITVDGDTIAHTGASPTARNISLSNITVIAPLALTNSSTSYSPDYCIRISSYENVQLTNIAVSDGYLDIADDYDDYVANSLSSDSLIRIYHGASNISLHNLSINGFSDIERGLWTSDSCGGPFYLDGFTSTAGPQYPIRCSASGSIYKGIISNFLIKGNQSAGAGVYTTCPNIQVGQGIVTGYELPVKGILGSTSTNQPDAITFSRPMRSSDNVEATPYSVINFDQHEEGQNVGKGEGLKISWRKQEITDTEPEEVCFIGSFKEATTDTNDDYSLVVGTTTTAGTVTKKFEFTSDANFLPSGDDSQDLGSSSNRWDDVFATNGTIQTSDERQKQNIETITEAEKRVALVLKGKLKKYKFKAAVTSKGDNARIHFGIVAQEIKTAFEAESLDPASYGMFCYDEMYTTDEEGNKTKVGDSYGVRYNELFAFILAAL
tara:strand:- start:3634 stop:6621 length:2988 start_codon:yes stop_codon:yes gene_type:complete